MYVVNGCRTPAPEVRTWPAVPIDLNPNVHGPPAGSRSPYNGIESRPPTTTFVARLGRHRKTVDDAELTVPLTDVTRPVVPAGIAIVTSRIAPAFSTVARYVNVVVPFDAKLAVTVTLAAAASAAGVEARLPFGFVSVDCRPRS